MVEPGSDAEPTKGTHETYATESLIINLDDDVQYALHMHAEYKSIKKCIPQIDNKVQHTCEKKYVRKGNDFLILGFMSF